MAEKARVGRGPAAAGGGSTADVGGARRSGLEGLSFGEQRQRVAPGVSSGSPAAQGLLDPPVSLPFRAEMERSFGRDFGGVVAHVGPNAAAANIALGSRACTKGAHVVLGTATPDRALVAHELAHVVQQGAAGPASEVPDGALPAASHEDEADQAAAAVLRGQAVEVRGNAPVGVQTWKGREHAAIGDAAWTSVAASDPALGALMGDASQAVAVGSKGNGTRIGYGEANRRAGDHAFTVGDLHKGYGDPNQPGKSHERAGQAPHTVALAKKEWKAHHVRALKAAALAHEAVGTDDHQALFDKAIRTESFAAHFLEDAFCAGHQTMKDLAWIAGGPNRPADRLGNQRYHDWFNANGLDVVTDGKPGAPPIHAYGDGALSEAQGNGYAARVTEAVALSLRHVVEVAAGQRTLKQAAKQGKAVLALVPHVDAADFEATGAGDEGWLQAAAVETMIAGYQKIHARAKGSTQQKRTQSGVAVSGKELANDATLKDLFDGEFNGRHGKAADRLRVARDLDFLAKTLEPTWAGAGGEKERGRFAGELLRTLAVRIGQLEAHVSGPGPVWLQDLKLKVYGEWKKCRGDLPKRRDDWHADVLALRARIPEAA
ncbi:MAG: hypothetical protein AMXMBFR64_48120 [Myxococcales bacterium]